MSKRTAKDNKPGQQSQRTGKKSARPARQTRWLRGFWWLFLAVFIASGIWLGYYGVSTVASDRAIADMGETITRLRVLNDESEAGAKASPAPEQVPEEATASAPETDTLLAYYRELAAENPDLTGWVSISDTVVDYPVMYTPGEPQHYLHRDFQNYRSVAGVPFLDARCNPESRTENRILYAHNMRSGQMFAPLIGYLEPDFLEAHPTIQFDTLSQRGSYTVFAVLQINLASMDAPSMQCYRLFDTALLEDVDTMNVYLQKYATVRTGEIQRYDQILTLSTCQHLGSIDRLVVMAGQAGTPPDVVPNGE